EILVGVQRILRNPSCQVAGVDGNNLSITGETTAVGQVKRDDHSIRVEAGVAGIVGPVGGGAGELRGGDVVEVPVRRRQGSWVTRGGDGKDELADVRGFIDVNIPDNEPPITPH